MGHIFVDGSRQVDIETVGSSLEVGGQDGHPPRLFMVKKHLQKSSPELVDRFPPNLKTMDFSETIAAPCDLKKEITKIFI